MTPVEPPLRPGATTGALHPARLDLPRSELMRSSLGPGGPAPRTDAAATTSLGCGQRPTPAPGSHRHDAAILAELEAVVEVELERHLQQAKEWMPHEYIPWDSGQNYPRLGGRGWSVEQSAVPAAVATALTVNLLTEDNLPSYHFEIATLFGRDSAWGEWVHRWTAEEGRHSQVIRDYLLVTRACDPVALERERMEHMSRGWTSSEPQDVPAMLAYLALQELATRLAHRNLGRVSGDPVAETLFARIAADENLHMLLYRRLVQVALELEPDRSMRAVTRVVKGFRMPGHQLPGFRRKALQIATAGIYDIGQHLDEVVLPMLRHWDIFSRDFGAQGEQARLELCDHLEALRVSADRFCERRAASAALP